MYSVGVNEGGKHHFMSFSTAMMSCQKCWNRSKMCAVLRIMVQASFSIEEDLFCSRSFG